MGADRVTRHLAIIILAASISLGWVQPAFALRYVKFEISIDSRVVLETSQGDNGRADVDTVWKYLNELELRSVKKYQVEADTDDPLKATLKGKVVIDAPYGGRVEVKELKLVREMVGKQWKVAPAEVERTFKIRTTRN